MKGLAWDRKLEMVQIINLECITLINQSMRVEFTSSKINKISEIHLKCVFMEREKSKVIYCNSFTAKLCSLKRTKNP